MAADSFPAGLRVLVVDDDPTWLKILEKMLKKCSYEVTTCGLAREALKLLRERKDGYDIVISDVYMPDMDGFKLLELVGLEMDLPVIMMSVDGETRRVMKGVQHGACDYLLKPIRMKELKNIWQHVFRKRLHEARDIEFHDIAEDNQLLRNRIEFSDSEHLVTGVDQILVKKRKDIYNKHDDKELNDLSSAKKPRVVWSVDLHQKFVKAVNQIGLDKVGPKKILDLMDVPWLTRENIASHLQKYRLYLSRLQNKNELKRSYGGSKSSDQSLKDAEGCFGIHNTTSKSSMQQTNDLVGNLKCPDYKPPVQTVDTIQHEIDPKDINVLPLTEPGKPFNSEISVIYNAPSSSQMGHDCSSGSFESPLAYSFSWSRKVQDSLLKLPSENEYRAHNQLADCFNNKQTIDFPQQQIQADLLEQPAACYSPRQLVCERDKAGNINTRLLSAENRRTIESPYPKNSYLSPEIFEANPRERAGIIDTKLLSTLGTASASGSLPDDLSLYLLQGGNFATTSMGFDNTGILDYNFPDLINEASPICLHEIPRFDFEHLCDPVEYTFVGQGLFIS